MEVNKRKKDFERAKSTLSVSGVDYCLSLPVTYPPSPAVSTVTLTPGRIRNIDQDMENLRASRRDNPFIKQVIASRESLIDNSEEESDNAILMAKDLPLDLDMDPMSLPEIHEHMIRSPPPINWPKSPDFRIFHFPNGDETLQVEINAQGKSKTSEPKSNKNSSWDASSADTTLLRSYSKSSHHHHYQDRFSLLTPSNLKSSEEDSIYLMAED